MSGTTVLPCNCQHEQQDKIYGKGNRLHNLSGKEKEAYCTVCSPSNRRNKQVGDAEATPRNPFNQTFSVSARPNRRGKKTK